ncbi:MAG: hypothetical protein ACRDRX_01135 [Pseudonocardiaceae bacterium]
MNQTPPPDDPTAPAAEPSPEPTDSPQRTDPPGRAPRGAGMRRRAIPLIAGAVVLLLAGGAGGYLVAHQGSTRAVDRAADVSFDPPLGEAGPDGPGGFGDFGDFGSGHHGGPGHRGRGAAGTIDSVNGTTITLTTRDGRKLTVTAAGAVPVILRSQGSVADLKPGQSIVVSGPTGSDGSVIANRIAVGGNPPK